jgi:outer membrane protein assembly factor BamA
LAGAEAPRPPDGTARTRFIPLPLYATLPNEGSTYGVMPVILRVAPNGDTTGILAPSVSWNKVVKITGTFRGYRYFTETRSLTLIASASTHINRSVTLQYLETTRLGRAFTTNAIVQAKQNVFYRFFGLGPETHKQDESSYTRRFVRGYVREGLNLLDGFNVAVVLEGRADATRREGVPGLPLAQDRYGATVSFDPAAVLAQGLSVSYDSRPHGDYSTSGFASELTGTFNEGLQNSGSFARLVWHTRGLWEQTGRLLGAARLYLERVLGSDDVPFYYQPALGGELLLRGFTENRFVARGSWTFDLEERIRLLRTHIFGVVADWRIDPFVTVGQVYDRAEDAFDRVQVAGGLGFRSWVHPNILGRVDVAYAADGLKVYVVLGYPL